MKKLITICAVIGILLTASSPVKGTLDTRLAIYFDGADGATATVDSSPQHHTVSLLNGAQLDTAEKKRGSASLLLDGSGDCLTSADSADWDILASNTDNWTIDFYVKHNSTAGWQVYLSHFYAWYMHYDNGLGFQGSGISLTPASPISDSEWHWITFCKVGDKYAMYKDGTQINYTQDSDTGSIDYTLTIGGYLGSLYCVNGHMDELRITHENLFGASPNANKTDVIGYVAHTPEPTTVCLLGLGALSLLRRKHRA